MADRPYERIPGYGGSKRVTGTRMRGLVAVRFVAILCVGACGTSVVPGSGSVGVGSVSAAPHEPSTAELADARRFRTTFGLRADDAWIRSVALDPASDRGQNFGVPLLVDEVSRVMTAQASANAVSDIVAAYGANAGTDWAGMYVDQRADGTVVALFKSKLSEHRDQLLKLLPAGARVDVRSATWTAAELHDFIDRIEADRDWFSTIGAAYVTADLVVVENRIDVRFQGPDPDAARTIQTHFGDPPWLRAVWDGPGPWTGRVGDLDVYTVDGAGHPRPHIDIVFTPLDVRVRHDGDIGFGTDDDGHFLRRNLPTVKYRVSGWVVGPGDQRVLAAERVVSVPAGGRTSVRLVIE